MIHIVLYEPEIPQNTGNIMRTCMATNTALHLIKPLGFQLDEKHLRRSAMDYIKDVSYQLYEDWEDFITRHPSENYYFMTRYAKQAPSDIHFDACQGDIYLILGKESTGIPAHILSKHLDHCMRLPMVENARSLNLSNCAAIIVYEVERQLQYPGLSKVGVIKGEDWLCQ